MLYYIRKGIVCSASFYPDFAENDTDYSRKPEESFPGETVSGKAEGEIALRSSPNARYGTGFVGKISGETMNCSVFPAISAARRCDPFQKNFFLHVHAEYVCG